MERAKQDGRRKIFELEIFATRDKLTAYAKVPGTGERSIWWKTVYADTSQDINLYKSRVQFLKLAFGVFSAQYEQDFLKNGR